MSWKVKVHARWDCFPCFFCFCSNTGSTGRWFCCCNTVVALQWWGPTNNIPLGGRWVSVFILCIKKTKQKTCGPAFSVHLLIEISCWVGYATDVQLWWPDSDLTAVIWAETSPLSSAVPGMINFLETALTTGSSDNEKYCKCFKKWLLPNTK